MSNYIKIYLQNSKKEYDAYGEYNPCTKETVVLKGSVVSRQISNAPTFRGTKSIKKSREKYVENYIVTENVIFKSASTAGNFVTGHSTDGPRAWKTEDGITLKEYFSAANIS